MWETVGRRSSLAIFGSLVLVLTVSAGAAGAATVTVCPAGCDSATIQGAVTMAASGDTIQILSSQAHTEGDIFVGTTVTIAGFDPTTTVVQADANPWTATVPVFVIVNGATVTMQQLTIRHGGGFFGGGVNILDGHLVLNSAHVELNEATNEGGGIFVPAGGSLEIVDSWVGSNRAGDHGGGISNAGTAEITGSWVNDNTIPLGLSGEKSGGGIINRGDLTLSASQVGGNVVNGSFQEDALGGGLCHEGTSLVVEDASISGNLVDGGQLNQGGGIFLGGSMPVTISRTSIRNNDADQGGGLSLHQGDLIMEDCTISNNTASWIGGGLELFHFPPSLASIVHTTIRSNQASVGGGLAVRSGGATRIVNSTVSGNSATDDAGGLFLTQSNDVSVANTTITDNTADSDGDGDGNGGGIVIASGGDVEMRNTILADNHDGSTFPSPQVVDCSGTIQSVGYNLIRSLGHPVPACTIEGDTTGNITGTDPVLLPLADNGGPTETHELGAVSPAVDAGNPAGCTDPDGSPLPTDQRHGFRQDRCDMGAYEVGADFGLIFADGFESGGTGEWSSVSGG